MPKKFLLLRQGILGVYTREPLLDWQKEGRLLKDARTDSTQAADAAEDMHIAAKVPSLLPCTLKLGKFDPLHCGVKYTGETSLVVATLSCGMDTVAGTDRKG